MCAQCGSVFAGTFLRLVLNSVAVGVLGFLVIRALKGGIAPVILLPAVGVTLVLLLFNLPWQMKKIGEAAETGDKRTARRKCKVLANGLGGLQVFVGLGAVAGGLGLILKPSGANLGIPIELLEKTPFSTYLIPGLVLLAVNGLGSLVGAAASFTRYRYAGDTAVVLGGFLVVWITLQVYWFAGFHWLHTLYLGLGILELVLGWSLRGTLRGRSRLA
jgi:hypothetical protein